MFRKIKFKVIYTGKVQLQSNISVINSQLIIYLILSSRKTNHHNQSLNAVQYTTTILNTRIHFQFCKLAFLKITNQNQSNLTYYSIKKLFAHILLYTVVQ